MSTQPNAQTAGEPDDLGTRIRHRRQALGLSTAEIAERTGLPPGRIEHIETRPFALTGAELVRLSQALELSVRDLAGPRRPAPGRRIPRAPVLEPMRAEECRRLIEGATVGRIAYDGADGLTVVPVNYCTVGSRIVFRTAADSAVAQYDLAPIAFELDLVDEGLRDGWSVLVNGHVRPATRSEINAARGRVTPWAGGTRDTYLTIEPTHTTGRRIRSW